MATTDMDAGAAPVRGGAAGPVLAMLLAALGTSIPNVSLPELAAGFAAPMAAVQWVVTGYLLALTAGIVLAGRLGDLVGHGRALIAGTLLFALAGLVAALAPALPVLVAARIAQGLGAALMMALPAAHLRAVTPAAGLGAAMGMLGTASAVGTALGPALGGAAVAAFGWRAIFLLTAGLGAAAAAVLSRGGAPGQGRERVQLDVRGAGLLALAVAAYALGLTRAEGWSSAALLGLAATAFVLFLRWEAAASSPLVDPAALREPGLAAGMAMNFLIATVMMATLIAGPVYLSRALGMAAAELGLVLAVGPVISALCGVPSGRLVDRFGGRKVMAAGLSAAMAGALGIAVLPMAFGPAGWLAAIAVLTPGYQLFQAANTTVAMAAARADRRGVVSALLGLARNLGLITGAAGLGGLFAALAAPGDIASVAWALRATFAVAAALAALALAIALRSRRE